MCVRVRDLDPIQVLRKVEGAAGALVDYCGSEDERLGLGFKLGAIYACRGNARFLTLVLPHHDGWREKAGNA